MRLYNTLLGYLFLSTLITPLASADVYKTVDKNGRTVYTDTPPANSNAKPIELQTTNTIPSLSRQESAPAEPIAAPTQDLSNYQIEIISPANGTTLMPDERTLEVSVSMNQNIQGDMQLAYKIDGITRYSGTEMTTTLTDIPNGEHTLTVDLVDSDNQSFAKSNAVKVLALRPIFKQKTPTVPTKK